jgi:transcriptional regulator with XRE-family HTH domain
MDFGAALRLLRLRSRLTQETLAERAGLSVRTIRGMESGRVVQPRDSSIRCLADALQLEDGERTSFAALARHAYWTSRLMAARAAAEYVAAADGADAMHP